MVSVPTKWKLIAGLVLLVAGGSFFAAFQMIARQRLLQPAGPNVNIKDIAWLLKAGCVLLFFGQTILTSVAISVAARKFDDWRKRRQSRFAAQQPAPQLAEQVWTLDIVNVPWSQFSAS